MISGCGAVLINIYESNFLVTNWWKNCPAHICGFKDNRSAFHFNIHLPLGDGIVGFGCGCNLDQEDRMWIANSCLQGFWKRISLAQVTPLPIDQDLRGEEIELPMLQVILLSSSILSALTEKKSTFFEFQSIQYFRK